MKSFSKTILIIVLVLLAVPIPFVDGAEWLDGWDYKQGVTISGSAGAGTNYQVFLNVPYDANMQIDFDDLRFTDDDGSTLLDYWIEKKVDSSYAYVWIEVTDNLDNEQTIWMYYGNVGASTTSNGTDTFLFYEDWSTEAVDPSMWNTIDTSGSISFDDTDADHGSVIKVEGNVGANVYQIRAIPTSAAPTSIIGRVYLEKTVQADQRVLWGMSNTGTLPEAFVLSLNGADTFQVRDDGGENDDQPMSAAMFDSYHNFMITRDGTNAKLYDDYSLIETGSLDPDVTGVANIITLYVQDSEYDLYMDWSAQRKFVSSEPVASFGAWSEVYTARFIFPVSWDPITQFGYDMFFVALGLIMIPASTLYLVRGGRKEMNRDKLFYGLIMLIVGLGLLIGGIMP